MKEDYIRRVRRALHLPAKAKKEVVRDLNEIFSSAAEHGEHEQQVIERLGSPQEFADSAAEQLGVDNAARRRRRACLLGIAALLFAAVCFTAYAAARSAGTPEGVIGAADAMTNIRIEGAFGFDVRRLLPLLGAAGVVSAAICLLRAARERGKRQ